MSPRKNRNFSITISKNDESDFHARNKKGHHTVPFLIPEISNLLEICNTLVINPFIRRSIQIFRIYLIDKNAAPAGPSP